MSFNTYTFLLFIVVFYPLYLTLRFFSLPWKWFLLISSWVFYSWAYPPYLFLLLFSTFVDFHCGKAMLKYPHKDIFFLKISLIANLGLLFFFKYTNFFLDNLSQTMPFDIRGIDIVLPIGISFYTFQSMSYSIDIYRGQLLPKKNFLDFAIYVAFFPQLVAGPILFAKNFLQQINKKFCLKSIDWERAIISIVSGAVLKLVIADGLATEVDAFFEKPSDFSPIAAWYYLFAYSAQIFCDFAGYSSIAIGISALMGFHIPRNFNSPYFSNSLKDFWKRWHISLSQWLREYLYIPLGGNRYGSLFTIRNLLITMLLGGLWHGAGWNFIIWGGLHGVGLGLNHIISGNKHKIPYYIHKIIYFTRYPLTFFFIMLCWVFFRSIDLENSLMVLCALWPDNLDLGRSVDYREKDLIIYFLLHHIISAITYKKIKSYISWPLRLLGLLILLELLLTSQTSSAPFIYFSF